MHRRRFISFMGACIAGAVAPLALPMTVRAETRRTSVWQPSQRSLLGAEWRYLAGRMTVDGRDEGFIVSIGRTRSLSSLTAFTYQLLVERTDLQGTAPFAHAIYAGQLSFASGIYRFSSAEASLTWRLDDAAQVYTLTLASPLLSFAELTLRPYGALIEEGGVDVIDVGETNIAGVGQVISSDYDADWVSIEQNGVAIGVGRLDMQCLFLSGQTAQASGDYDHHWFAVAGEAGGAPVYVSAWRIESSRGPRWAVTIAQGAGTTWLSESLIESSGAAYPLNVQPLQFQPLPGPTPPVPGFPNQTGSSWHITAGRNQAGDLLDLVVAVPAGQFVTLARFSTNTGQALLEAVGTVARGTIRGQPVTNTRLVVAESTVEFAPQLLYLPMTQ